jgi:hypothetical protein
MPHQVKKTAAGRSSAARQAENKAEEAGKQRFALRYLIVAEDMREEFTSFERSLRAELRPNGCHEDSTFAILLRARWNLRRIQSYEEALFAKGDPFVERELADSLRLLLAYERSNFVMYRQALEDLQIQQSRRLSLQHVGDTLSPDGKIVPIIADPHFVQRTLVLARELNARDPFEDDMVEYQPRRRPSGRRR